jgi:hypothetical protein
VLLPVYAAFAAAFVFYLLIPVAGAFRLRSRWRKFRTRVAQLCVAPSLRYRDLAAAEREGRGRIGRFRLQGTIEAIEGQHRVWVRGEGVSALVDLSRAPLYVAAPGAAEAGSIERLRWSSLSSLVEGTRIFVGGLLSMEEGRPVFIDTPDESLIAVCHGGDEKQIISRLIASGRAQNEYWNYPSIVSLSLGVATISGLLLLFGRSIFSSLRAIIFLAGALPILPFAPPGLALFFAYHRLWRMAIAARIRRDLLRLPLRFSSERRLLLEGETPPSSATWIGLPEESQAAGGSEPRSLTLFSPENPSDPSAETFIVEGEPETLMRLVERRATLYAGSAGLAFALALLVNFALAFTIWRLFF